MILETRDRIPSRAPGVSASLSLTIINKKNKNKTKTVTEDLRNGTFQQEDIAIVSIYAPNMRALKYIKKLITYIKELIDNYTIVLGYFTTPLHQWT